MSNPIDERVVDSWWKCSICRRQFDEGKMRKAHIIDNYLICQKCYNRGIFWAIREAWKEECLKRGNNV